jgi:hypothetical protein
MATNIDKFVEPSELPPGSVGVPVGTVLPWWPNVLGTPPALPVGFEYCDGTAVTTPGSVYLGQTKPNLMVTGGGGAKGFPRGGDATVPMGPAVPLATGGSDTHSHTTTSDGSGHTHQMQSHSHSMQNHSHTISPDGGHYHNDVAGSDFFNGGGALGRTETVANHSHTGATGAPSTASTGGPSNNTTTGGSVNHGHGVNGVGGPPLHTELAMIVRVI